MEEGAKLLRSAGSAGPRARRQQRGRSGRVPLQSLHRNPALLLVVESCPEP